MTESYRKTAGRQKLFDLLRQNSIPLHATEPAMKCVYSQGFAQVSGHEMSGLEMPRDPLPNLADLDTFDFSDPPRNSVDVLYGTR